MYRSVKAAKRCRQIDNFELNISVNGTSGAPKGSGLDATQVHSVTKNGTGDYTVKLKEKSQLDLVVIGLVSLTSGVSLSVGNITQDSFDVLAVDLSGAPDDADFNATINWLGSKHTF